MYSSVGGSSSVRMSSTADLPHVSIARLTFSESTSTSSSTETLLSIRTLRRCPCRSISYNHAALASPVPPGPSTSFQFIARASVGHTKSRRRVTFTNAGPVDRLLLGVGCAISGSPRRYVVQGAASLDDHVDCVVVRPDPDHVAV